MLKTKKKAFKVDAEILQRMIIKSRIEAVEAYKERLIFEMRMMSTPKQLGVVERAIKRINNFI